MTSVLCSPGLERCTVPSRWYALCVVDAWPAAGTCKSKARKGHTSVYLRRVSEVRNGGLGMKRKWAPFKYQYSRQVTLDLNFPVVAPLRRLCANIRRSHAPTVAREDNAKRRSHCASIVGRNVKDTLAERLRRRPAKPMGSPRVGSSPTGVVLAAHEFANN